jgi:anti-anti-sigma factor
MPHTLDAFTSSAAHADSPPRRFVCTWTEGGREAAWVHLAGELDVATVYQMERTLRRPEVQADVVVLDLRDLIFMDTTGVNALVNATVLARRAGRRLLLLRGSPTVDRMFALTGSVGDVEIGELTELEPAIRTLAGRAAEERALVG